MSAVLPDDLISLPDAPRALLDIIAPNQPANLLGYRRVYAALVDGRVPSEKIGSRRFVRRGALPEVAAVLGLALLHPPAAPSPRKART